jgi:hypothetical protein
MSQPAERDGFRLTQKVFVLPANPTSLDRVTKRKVTVCNLFTNYGLPIVDIVRLLDERHENVVNILLEGGLIHERRKELRVPAPGTECFVRQGSGQAHHELSDECGLP